MFTIAALVIIDRDMIGYIPVMTNERIVLDLKIILEMVMAVLRRAGSL